MDNKKEKLGNKYWNVPFVNEVETFNETFGKPNNPFDNLQILLLL